MPIIAMCTQLHLSPLPDQSRARWKKAIVSVPAIAGTFRWRPALIAHHLQETCHG
jgi:hypothetical protein